MRGYFLLFLLISFVLSVESNEKCFNYSKTAEDSQENQKKVITYKFLDNASCFTDKSVIYYSDFEFKSKQQFSVEEAVEWTCEQKNDKNGFFESLTCTLEVDEIEPLSWTLSWKTSSQKDDHPVPLDDPVTRRGDNDDTETHQQSGNEYSVFKYTQQEASFYIVGALEPLKIYTSVESLKGFFTKLDEDSFSSLTLPEPELTNLFKVDVNNNNLFYYTNNLRGDCFDFTTSVPSFKKSFKINQHLLLNKDDDFSYVCFALNSSSEVLKSESIIFKYESLFISPPPAKSFGSNAGAVFGVLLTIFFGVLLVLYLVFVVFNILKKKA